MPVLSRCKANSASQLSMWYTSARMSNWSQVEGSPQPLGCTWVEGDRCFNFALFSRHATSVTLLLYNADDLINPTLRTPLDYLTHKSGRIWHCCLSVDRVGEACYYAYSVDGPNNPAAQFHAFDSDKVLLDPYATQIFFPRDFRRSASVGRGSNAGRAPLGVLSRSPARLEPIFPSMPGHTSDTIIYEMH